MIILIYIHIQPSWH